jgi:DNA polymerase family B, exonuclease domain.
MDSICFQIIDISSDDIALDNDNFWDKDFLITFYGKTKDNLNIVCNVIGFKPYFYLRIPDNWGDSTLRTFLKTIKNFISTYKTGKNLWNGNYDQELLETGQSYNFYGFNYDYNYDKIKTYRFAKISFKSYGDLRKCTSAIQDFWKANLPTIEKKKVVVGYKGKSKEKKPIYSNDERLYQWFQQEHNCECVANLYESKIHPMLRFLHSKNIQSCGWVQINLPNESYLVDDDQQSFNVDIEIGNIPLKYIQSLSSEETARFITASFDIECDHRT